MPATQPQGVGAPGGNSRKVTLNRENIKGFLEFFFTECIIFAAVFTFKHVFRMKQTSLHTLFIIYSRRLAMFRVVLLCVALSVLAGCKGKKGQGGIQVVTKSEAQYMKAGELKPVTSETAVPEEEQVFDVKLDMDFLSASTPADSAACASINQYIMLQLLGQPAPSTQEEAMKGYIERLKQEFCQEEYLVTCYDHLTGLVEFGPRGIVNYMLKEEYFGGGAHPTMNITVKRFNTATGQPVELWDVFADSCSHTLEQLLTRRLMEQQKAKTLDDLREMGYLDMNDMFVPKNFWMYEDSVQFFFNQYEIAPYALGPTFLTFSYDELRPYMR